MGAKKTKVWDRESAIAANEQFYAVFRSGDFARMERLWSGRDAVSVYHPNWPGIIGRDDVMASWYQVMVLSDPPEIFVSDQTVILAGRTAMVFCTEQLGDVRMTASNVFILEDDCWRMTNHHACPIPENAESGEGEDGGDGEDNAE